MGSDIKITTQSIEADKDMIIGFVGQMIDDVDSIERETNAMNDYWDSKSEGTIKNKLLLMCNEFRSCEDLIREFAAFLGVTVEAYENAEKANLSAFDE